MTLTVALLVIAEATSGAAAIPLLPESLSEPVPKCQHQGKTVNAPKITERQRAMYMQHLAAANEEPLITLHRKFDDKGGSSVRFLWLRSFDAPIIARVHG